jgi:hypothetical protein
MHTGVPITIGYINVATRSDCQFGRVIKGPGSRQDSRLALAVIAGVTRHSRRAQSQEPNPVGTELGNAVCSLIDAPNGALVVDGNCVRASERRLPPCLNERTITSVHDHPRIKSSYYVDAVAAVRGHVGHIAVNDAGGWLLPLGNGVPPKRDASVWLPMVL